jgi:hypothetical protein
MILSVLQTRGRGADILRAAVPPGGILLLDGVLLRFPPAQFGFYPVCPFHELLGLQCPGCGATRALASLLHGHLAEAMHFNALTTLLAPLALVYGVLCYWDFVRRRAIRPLRLPSSATYAALALAILFTVCRNLQLASF